MIADLVDLKGTFEPFAKGPWASSGAQVVESTDKFTPEASWRSVAKRAWADVLVPSTYSKPGASCEVADSGWFSASLLKLAELRRSEQNVTAEVLQTTEYLIAHFAVWPESRRPELTLDPFGMPHFTAKRDGYYLHLSVEDDATLNWFARLHGQERSQESGSIQGAAVPAELASLVTA